MNAIRKDLSVEVFLSLGKLFFDVNATPLTYTLRDKRNTQDDPLDEYISGFLDTALPGDIEVEKSTGPLISPDMVVYKPAEFDGVPRIELLSDPTRIFGLEVKKLERQPSGMIARASGLDYNTTPPCGTVRVYDSRGDSLDVKGYYLFVCQEVVDKEARTYRLTALVLCDGNLLNEDFEYYRSIVGHRSKEIGLGTYGDGANRVRPMIIFANPLGTPLLDRHSTLIHTRDDLESEYPRLQRVGLIERTVEAPDEGDPYSRVFHCYRNRSDMVPEVEPFHARDPFPTPKRSSKTVSRGRFIVQVRPFDGHQRS